MPVEEGTLGSRLREARRAAGMTTQELADRTALSTALIGAHERGLRGLSIEAAKRYAEVLGISPGWLVFGEPEGGELVELARQIRPEDRETAIRVLRAMRSPGRAERGGTAAEAALREGSRKSSRAPSQDHRG